MTIKITVKLDRRHLRFDSMTNEYVVIDKASDFKQAIRQDLCELFDIENKDINLEVTA